MSRTLTISDELYERLEDEARSCGLDNVERLLEEVGRSEVDPDVPALSVREQKILSMLAAGHSNRAIAAALDISHVTVRAHIFHIFAKLNIGSYAGSDRPTDVVLRIDDLRGRLSAKYGEMRDSTELLIEDRAR